MKRALWILFFANCLFPNVLFAQQKWNKCGFSIVKASMEARNPGFEERLNARLKERQNTAAKLRTAKSTLNFTVPVVFHIILNETQLALIGDSVGIAQRIQSQIEVLNEDYNRGNADSVDIPDAFKPLYANANIKFGLAHTDPNGNATDGWDIKQTTLDGFDVYDQSGQAAKHAASGGTDAWDVNSYLNIWVVNMLEGTAQSMVIGLTVPPSFADSSAQNTDPYPKNEIGVMLRYDAFGKRTNSLQYFYSHVDLGRTCTHEVGHYFDLFHPWGDDNGSCPWNGGADDGIADTPPECDANYGCPDFPKYDCCTKTAPGIMFMNYMDYSDDACMNMFTKDQVNVMDQDIAVGYTHTVLSHPQLLDYPTTTQPKFDYTYYIYPNPSVSGKTSVSFNQIPQGFLSISIYNSIGQPIKYINTAGQQTTYYPVDLSGFGRGMYFLKIHFNNKTDIKKIIVL